MQNTVNGLAKGQPSVMYGVNKEYGVSRDFIVKGIRSWQA